MNRNLLVVLALGALVILPACSWFKDKPEKEEEEKNEPAPLVAFKQEVKLAKVWSADIGGSSGKRIQRLTPAIVASRIFAASPDGNVVALALDDGKRIWRVRLGDLFREERQGGFWSRGEEHLVTGGVGAGGDLVVVATVTGEIVALHQSDGSLAWRARTPSEVVAPPQIGSGVVVAQSIDGHVTGYDADDGTQRWSYSTSVPVLTLRGTATPLVVGQFVVCGFANGRVTMIDIRQGSPRWEQRIAVAQGQTELDRLIDVDGGMAVVGDQLYAVSYQGYLMAMDMADGEIRWAKEASSFSGVGEGFGNIYIAYADGRLAAVDRTTNRDVWQVDALLNRELTTPVAIGNHVAVGDFAGYVHLFAQSDGRMTARKRVDRSALRSRFLSADNRLYVQGSSGQLTVLEIR